MQIFRVGLLLGLRQIQRANRWTTFLIIVVMTLTFLNLVAVSGILVGLITGSERAVQEKLIGDVLISSLDDEDYILRSPLIINTLRNNPSVYGVAPRLDKGGSIEANYRSRRNFSKERDIVNARITGIEPLAEEKISRFSENIVEGEPLLPDDTGYVLIGAILIDRFTEDFPDIANSLSDIYPGDTVRISVGSVAKEYTVKGIVDAKVGELTTSVFMPLHELQRLSKKHDYNVSRISVKLHDPDKALPLQDQLYSLKFNQYGKIQTFEQALPKFIQDIKNTFNILGAFIGAVGIIVASITIFIIIFINALSRRRQIGILKGIGIDHRAIEIAYIMQATIYVVSGSLIGAIIIYGFLIGYFDNNPIDFPFSDGILVADPISTLIRFSILFVVTLAAGFIPAWLIVKQNTLNAILGRK